MTDLNDPHGALEDDLLFLIQDGSGREHIYTIEKARDGWGVFCTECSRLAEDYIYPCRLEPTGRDVPPQWLEVRRPAIEVADKAQHASEACCEEWEHKDTMQTLEHLARRAGEEDT